MTENEKSGGCVAQSALSAEYDLPVDGIEKAEVKSEAYMVAFRSNRMRNKCCGLPLSGAACAYHAYHHPQILLLFEVQSLLDNGACSALPAFLDGDDGHKWCIESGSFMILRMQPGDSAIIPWGFWVWPLRRYGTKDEAKQK